MVRAGVDAAGRSSSVRTGEWPAVSVGVWLDHTEAIPAPESVPTRSEKGRQVQVREPAAQGRVLRNRDDVHVANSVSEDPVDDVLLVNAVREADARALPVDHERVDAEDDVSAVVEDRPARVAEAGPAAAAPGFVDSWMLKPAVFALCVLTMNPVAISRSRNEMTVGFSPETPYPEYVISVPTGSWSTVPAAAMLAYLSRTIGLSRINMPTSLLFPCRKTLPM